MSQWQSQAQKHSTWQHLQALGPLVDLALGGRAFGREEHGFGRREKSPATVIDVLMKSKEFREFITEVVKAVRQG